MRCECVCVFLWFDSCQKTESRQSDVNKVADWKPLLLISSTKTARTMNSSILMKITKGACRSTSKEWQKLCRHINADNVVENRRNTRLPTLSPNQDQLRPGGTFPCREKVSKRIPEDLSTPWTPTVLTTGTPAVFEGTEPLWESHKGILCSPQRRSHIVAPPATWPMWLLHYSILELNHC